MVFTKRYLCPKTITKGTQLDDEGKEIEVDCVSPLLPTNTIGWTPFEPIDGVAILESDYKFRIEATFEDGVTPILPEGVTEVGD